MMYFFLKSVQSVCIPPQFFSSWKKYLLSLSIFYFAPDEVEFQEDGKLSLVCASRCFEEVYVGLDSSEKGCLLCSSLLQSSFSFFIFFIYFSSTAFQEDWSLSAEFNGLMSVRKWCG